MSPLLPPAQRNGCNCVNVWDRSGKLLGSLDHKNVLDVFDGCVTWHVVATSSSQCLAQVTPPTASLDMDMDPRMHWITMVWHFQLPAIQSNVFGNHKLLTAVGSAAPHTCIGDRGTPGTHAIPALGYLCHDQLPHTSCLARQCSSCW